MTASESKVLDHGSTKDTVVLLTATQRRFNAADTLVRYAWVLHLTAGFLVLVLGSAFPSEKDLVPLFAFLAAAGNAVFPLLQSAKNCNYVGVLSQAIGAVIFFTGHILICSYVIKLFFAAQLPNEIDITKEKFAYMQNLFWAPMSTIVGMAAYWVTYVEMANGTHIICASNAARVFMFRLAPTIATPFVVGMALAPAFTLIHFLIGKFKNFKGVK